jgi:hypothetical protein
MPTRAHEVISSFPRGCCYLEANLVTVTISVVIARSSLMAGEKCRNQGRVENRKMMEVTGTGLLLI